MPTIEEALYAALAAAPGVAGLVGDRIYPMAIPQEATTPAIAYQRVSGQRPMAHSLGGLGVAMARIQLTITAAEYRNVKAVCTAIRDLFPFRGILGGLVEVYGGRVENEVDGWGSAVEMPTTRIDLWFLYSE